MKTLISVYMWAVWLAFAIVVLPLIIAAVAIFPRRWAYAFGRRMIGICFLFTGIRVKGIGRWPVDRPLILMGNHVNFLDPFVFSQVFPVPIVAVEKRENFKIPVYGWFIKRWGNFPIDRHNREQAIEDLKRAGEGLSKDCWIMILPEGTRTRTGELGPFKKGGFHLAMSIGVPIASCSMRGAFQVLRTGNWLARPGIIELELHPPIDPADFGPDRIDDFMAAVHGKISRGLGQAPIEAPVKQPVGSGV